MARCARARSKILSSYVLLSTGNALVAGLRQRSKIYGPASESLPGPPLVLAEGRAVRRVRVPGPGGGRRPLCGQRPPFHSQIPQLCFGFTILLISVLHTVGTWIGLPTVPSTSSDIRDRPDPKTDQKKKERKAKSPVSTTSMLRRLAGLTSGTTADGAQTATPRIFGRRRAAEAKPPPDADPSTKRSGNFPHWYSSARRKESEVREVCMCIFRNRFSPVIYHPLPTTHHPPPTTHHSPPTTHHPPHTSHHPPIIFNHS